MSESGKKTVLLVEDEFIIALSEKKSLEIYGYSVLVVNTGEKAVEAADSTPSIDLILMDINLGDGIDGTQAAEIILADHDIPVVFVSSHTEPEVVAKTEKITSYGYVVKSSSITVLDASIKMAFKLFNANKSTRLANDKLRATINALPDLFFEVGLDGYYYSYHSSHNDLLYRSSSDLLGKFIPDVLPAEVSGTIMSAISEAHEKGISLGRQYELEVPAGICWFEIAVTRIVSYPDRPHFILLCRDITEQKKTEMALKKSEQVFRDIVTSSSDWVWEIDENGVYTYSSHTATDLFGIPQEEVIGKTPFDFMPEDEAKVVAERLSGIIASGSLIKDLENWNINKDGKMICLLTNGIPFFDEEGRLKGYRGVDKDITEQKRLEEVGSVATS
jgi:PAS domain S-box-containing protein